MREEGEDTALIRCNSSFCLLPSPRRRTGTRDTSNTARGSLLVCFESLTEHFPDICGPCTSPHLTSPSFRCIYGQVSLGHAADTFTKCFRQNYNLRCCCRVFPSDAAATFVVSTASVVAIADLFPFCYVHNSSGFSTTSSSCSGFLHCFPLWVLLTPAILSSLMFTSAQVGAVGGKCLQVQGEVQHSETEEMRVDDKKGERATAGDALAEDVVERRGE